MDPEVGTCPSWQFLGLEQLHCCCSSFHACCSALSVALDALSSQFGVSMNLLFLDVALQCSNLTRVQHAKQLFWAHNVIWQKGLKF